VTSIEITNSHKKIFFVLYKNVHRKKILPKKRKEGHNQRLDPDSLNPIWIGSRHLADTDPGFAESGSRPGVFQTKTLRTFKINLFKKLHVLFLNPLKRMYGSRFVSGSGSFHHQAKKISKKTLFSTVS
jgi:hypothetical protein